MHWPFAVSIPAAAPLTCLLLSAPHLHRYWRVQNGGAANDLLWVKEISLYTDSACTSAVDTTDMTVSGGLLRVLSLW